MQTTTIVLLLAATATASALRPDSLGYAVVDTAQVHCYDDRSAIDYPTAGSPYFGQDAQYLANSPAYKVNGDGTVSDKVTGLMWTQDPGEKKSYDEAVAGAAKCSSGGHSDWRLPTIKELYSLIQFNGTDPDPNSHDSANLVPFIDRSVFDFQYGDAAKGERVIDSQFATCTLYVSTTMGGNKTMFGVNFADGRIKGYPAGNTRGRKKGYYVLYVRSNPDYGINQFKDNRDGTVTDEATGLTWTKADSGQGMDWPAALEYAEQLELAGCDDWRLPNAKELQSIVDYTRSPDTTGSAAIDPIFDATEITNEGGNKDFGCYWSSSSHLRGGGSAAAVYVSFGRALGWMSNRRSSSGEKQLMDVHGAGSQRSDPKVGDASRFPTGRGPQGDVIRIENMVRCVRGGNVATVEKGPKLEGQSAQPRRGPGGKDMPHQPGANRQQGPRGGGIRQGPGRGGFMSRFDANKDGKVTQDEFDGPADRFPRLDKDGNGIITEDEAPTGPPPGRARPTAGKQPAITSKDSPVQARAVNKTSSGKPNIVFILIDDMSWTGTSVKMDERVDESKSDFYKTPNINKLAEQGMRFSKAYSPGSMCTPTRAAILTGKTPAELHMTTPGPGRVQVQSYQKLIAPRHVSELPDSETTIAEVLKREGYATAHIGKWHLGRKTPGDHGFDVHDGATGNHSGGTDENPKDVFGITERALEFMSSEADGPFYLQVSHNAVHTPFQASTESIEKFSKLRKGSRHSDVDLAAMTYDLDTSIGILLGKLEDLGLAGNTYIVVMSDNGGPASPRQSQNLPLAGGKGTLYEGGIRVPLIVSGPGIEAGSFCRENVTGCDLFPTFCEWADVPEIDNLEGVSLVPLLTGDRTFQRQENAMLFHYPHYGRGPLQKPQVALIAGNDKLLKNLEDGSVKLFDLEADLSEEKDLSSKMPDKADQLEKMMETRLKKVGAQVPEKNPDYDPAASPQRGRRRSRVTSQQ